MGQLWSLLRSPPRWRELPAYAARRWRSRDRPWLGLYAVAHGNVASLDGCRFDLRGVSFSIKGRFVDGTYEAAERRLAAELLDPALPVIELGACLGVLACTVNRRLARPAEHVVVEANPALVPALERNRALNGAAFAIENAALGYGGATVDLHVHPRLVTASSAQRTRGRAVRVPALTLAALADRRGWSRFSLLCDVEGAEAALVEQDAATLRDRVDVALIEFHPDVYGRAAQERLHAAILKLGFMERASTGNVVAYRRVDTLSTQIGGRNRGP